MVLTHQNLRCEGLLYPLMVIASVAVIVFSLLGIASVSGVLPNAFLPTGTEPNELSVTGAPVQSDGGAFACAECRVIESVQKIDLRAPSGER